MKPTEKQIQAIINLQSYMGNDKIVIPKTKELASAEIGELIKRLPERKDELLDAYASYPYDY